MSGKFYELFISANLCIYHYFSQSVGRKSPRWKLVPTRREQEKWDRATKAATGGSVSHLYHFFNFNFFNFFINSENFYSSLLHESPSDFKLIAYHLKSILAFGK